MIKTDLLDKKSICHAIIYSSRDPETIIPIKGIIEDIHFQEDIPYYSIKLIKFYDNIHFLKEHFYEQPFLLKFNHKPKTFAIPKFRTVNELESWFIDECTHRFCIESNFVTRTKIEMASLFNKIEEYLIIKHYRSIKKSTMRHLYEGPLKMQSGIEFNERMKRAFSDKFNNQDDIDEFLSFI
jgi:hypothetical protein